MNTQELESYLKHIICKNKYFGGVLAANELPSAVDKKPCFFIVNIDENWKKGRHWVVLYFPDIGLPNFFDSLGMSPVHYNHIFNFLLLKEGGKYWYNCKRLQNFNSMYCGYYCLYFILCRCINIDYSDFILLFSDDLLNNDRLVKDKIELYFRK